MLYHPRNTFFKVIQVKKNIYVKTARLKIWWKYFISIKIYYVQFPNAFMGIHTARDGEQTIFLAALAPDFFPKGLWLLVFFFELFRLRFGKIFFSTQTSKVTLQKNIKQVICFLTVKTSYFT